MLERIKKFLVPTGRIYCEKCSAVIKDRDDLVTTIMMFFIVVPYHERCFVSDIKGAKSFVVDNFPLNGFTANVLSVLTAITGVVSLLIGDSFWIPLVALILIGYRAFSYLMFEIHTEKYN